MIEEDIFKALRQIILEASEDELYEAIESAGESPKDFVNRGRAVAERALAEYRAQRGGPN